MFKFKCEVILGMLSLFKFKPTFDHKKFQALAHAIIYYILPDVNDNMFFIPNEKELKACIKKINNDRIYRTQENPILLIDEPPYINVLLPIIQEINKIYAPTQNIVSANNKLYQEWNYDCNSIDEHNKPNEFAQRGESTGEKEDYPPEPTYVQIEKFPEFGYFMKQYVVDGGVIKYAIPDNMKGGKTKEHVPNAKKQTKWMSTGKKTVVAIKQGKKKVNVERVIYSNAKGDLRIRKITIMDDKTRQVKYIKF